MNDDFKTILVTGGSGYIGGAVCRLLVAQNQYNVVNIDRVKSDIPGVILYPFDIDNHQAEGIIKLLRPDTIIHLAADHEVGRSMSEPGIFYHNNVANTIKLLNSAVDSGVKNFIFGSSSSIYGDVASGRMTEDMLKEPKSPYARSKAIIEDVLADYEAAYGLKYAALRFFNVIGALPNMSHGYTQTPTSHLLPTLCRNALSGSITTVNGKECNTPDKTCGRDYTHICDIADAHLAAINYLEGGGASGAFNIGGGEFSTVFEMMAAVEEVSGKGPLEYIIGEPRVGDVKITWADIKKAQELLGWSPKYTTSDAVEHAWKWETRKRRKKND